VSCATIHGSTCVARAWRDHLEGAPASRRSAARTPVGAWRAPRHAAIRGETRRIGAWLTSVDGTSRITAARLAPAWCSLPVGADADAPATTGGPVARIGIQLMMLKDHVRDQGVLPVLERVRETGFEVVEVSQIPMTERN